MQLAFLRGTFWLLSILQLSSPAAVPNFSTGIIGLSVQERPLRYYRFGNGDVPLAVVATIHAGYEANTADAVHGLIQYYSNNPEELDKDLSLYLVPNINPDGKLLETRHNANAVDLNRNWDTPDWMKDIPGIWSLLRGEGGSHPFSEPESRGLRDFLLRVQQEHPWYQTSIIFLHSLRVPRTEMGRSPQGLVQPAYKKTGDERRLQQASLQAADVFADAGGYIRIESWIGDYPTPGEAIHWAALNGMIAFDVEFPVAEPLTPAVPQGNRYFSGFFSGIQSLLQELRVLASLQPPLPAE